MRFGGRIADPEFLILKAPDQNIYTLNILAQSVQAFRRSWETNILQGKRKGYSIGIYLQENLESEKAEITQLLETKTKELEQVNVTVEDLNNQIKNKSEENEKVAVNVDRLEAEIIKARQELEKERQVMNEQNISLMKVITITC